MATLALSAVGAAAGSALLPSGLSVLGASIGGAALGRAVGGIAGSLIDNALLGNRRRAVDGPRLSDLQVTSATEGAAIPRLYGRARLGGQLIWATALEEEAVSRDAPGGGKGAALGGNRASAGSDYLYFANIAVGLCEGEITRLGRVWADGRELDISRFTTRLHTGTQAQLPDALIEGKQGGDAPAYRGLAYIVFERLPLAEFGNRIPQFSFEVSRAVDTLERDLKGVVLIPGSGEFVYSPSPITRRVGRATTVAENISTLRGGTDWTVAIDQLRAEAPNATSVSFVVSWFGDDLRADQCTITPRVERTQKDTSVAWSVAGLDRAGAQTVSLYDNRPAYGGTPSDQTVVDAIRDLKARGLSVVFSPFILMDVPAVNGRVDPYTGAADQGAYPWRGRITVAPAAGRPGTPDKTAPAAAHIASFVGAAHPSHFAISGDDVVYSGPNEWSFRRFILHYAHLCAAAGGVDAFVLCSELRGLTTTRSATLTYPFVTALQQLAGEVRAILGPTTKILYAADWSEYFGHQPADGSNDVHFHLDPLWASPHIDAIGIDVYWPLADWRDGHAHLDALAGVPSPYDLPSLKSNLTAGEGFDWYYASDADRVAQNRTPITDALGRPWVFRYKDLRAWWSSLHRNRIAGVEQLTATAWVPQSKPFWFMEIGCPAVDKGANQPNVFVDAKSVESFLPYFSSGARDDLAQRRVLQAFVEAFDPAHEGFVASLNPVSTLTGQRMVDPARIHAYAWDARPFPAFPQRLRLWADGVNWPLGHWLTGRLADAPIGALVKKLIAETGGPPVDVRGLSGTVAGLLVDRVMSAREALSGLELAGFMDVVERERTLAISTRGSMPARAALTRDDLVETRIDAPLLTRTRSEDGDLPASAKVSFVSADGDYPAAVAEARRGSGASARVATASLGLVLDPADAQGIAESWLHEAWVSRERAVFALPPSRLALEPADLIDLADNGRTTTIRLTDIIDGAARAIEAVAIAPSVYRRSRGAPRSALPDRDITAGPPLAMLIDAPPAAGAPAHAGLVAAAQSPWPGGVAVFRSPETAGYEFSTLLPRAAITGLTMTALPRGPIGRRDVASDLVVEIDLAQLTSVTPSALFAGSNTAAIELAPDVWEVLQFEAATLIAPRTYRLRGLLRGQRGTESLQGPSAIAPGARFVLLDEAIRSVTMNTGDVGLPFNWKLGPANRDLGDASYVSTTQRFTGPGLKPLSPVHIRGARDVAGDLRLTWVRRTRAEGDAWDPPDIPLGETSERYRVEFFAGAQLKRTIETTSPTALYTAAHQIADFGAVQNTITLRIAQLNPDFGAGHPRTLTL